MAKQIGWIKCPGCGELIAVKEADNSSGTPWVNCASCHYRGFFNGIEGQDIRKSLYAGQNYRSAGGLEFKAIDNQNIGVGVF